MRRSLADRLVLVVKRLLAGVGVERRGRLTRNVGSFNRGRWSWEEAKMNMPKPKDKPFAIPKSMVWEAYRRVAANKGAPGVDGQALDEFEADLRDNLYRIWNRMSSGSYFRPGQGGGDPQAARRRGPSARRAHDFRQDRSDGRGHAVGAVGGAEVPPGLLWLPAGKVGPGGGLDMSASGVGSSTGSSILDVQKFFDTVPWDLVVKAVRGGHRLLPGCCCM